MPVIEISKTRFFEIGDDLSRLSQAEDLLGGSHSALLRLK